MNNDIDRICTEIATKNTSKFRYAWLLISGFCGVPLLVVHCPWFVLFSRLRQYICDFISSLAPLCPTIRFSNARYSQRINQGNFGQNRIGDATYTLPTAEILSGKNARAFLICGFSMKSFKKKYIF